MNRLYGTMVVPIRPMTSTVESGGRLGNTSDWASWAALGAVLAATHAMSPEARQDAAWVYWRARALHKVGKTDAARAEAKAHRQETCAAYAAAAAAFHASPQGRQLQQFRQSR